MPNLKYSDSSRFILQALSLAPNSIGMRKQEASKRETLDLLSNEEVIADTTSMNLFDLEEMLEFLSFGDDGEQSAKIIRPKPGLLLYNEKDIQEIIRILKLVFDQFKIALENKGVPVDNFTVTQNKNELTISNAFIKELISKNLFPKAYAPNQAPENQPTRLTPYTTTPTPRSHNEEEQDESAKEMEYTSGVDSAFNPSPFSFSLTKLFGR
ncbi:hypothetical protein [Legionella parisiensis]|uniref:Uncharacterized protein n=1 Tax=Legionella parisiensis TaxID=45071 RepID=A0A1E5JSZ6_9GAMM|nr:hypothetical protein [Legionella parisiensis]KTD40323.1 hypothetical protein Lpar_1640 [Legionella parisiensis]OEH47659.1 hypothetical protein lpari_01334 [Legionella parisiensis]STX77244.1 Uncharacterised protein [Legionella parisiensis]